MITVPNHSSTAQPHIRSDDECDDGTESPDHKV